MPNNLLVALFEMGDEEPKTKAKMNQYKLLLNSCIPKEKLWVKQSPVK
jgi:hypothetical protein